MRTYGTIALSAMFLWACSSGAAAQSSPASISFTNTDHPTNQESATGLVVADFAHHGTLQEAVIADDSTLTVGSSETGWNFYTTSAGPDQIVTADFNHDGNLDLAVEDSLDNRLTIFLGNGDGSFRAAPDVPLGGRPYGMAVTDIDFNGFADLAVLECVTSTRLCDIRMLRASTLPSSQGQFASSTSVLMEFKTLPQRPGMIVAADFDRDGRNDIALVVQNRAIEFFKGMPKGSGYPADLALRGPAYFLPYFATVTSIAWGAINKEMPSLPDLVVRTLDGCGASCGNKNSAYVYINDGSFSFHISARIALEPSTAGGLIGVMDVNGDQKQDVVSLSSDPYHPMLEYALGRGGGAFESTVQVMQLPTASNSPDVPSQPRWFVMRDLNRDSRQDIAFAGYDAIGDDMAGSFFMTNDNAATNCTPPSSARLGIHLCRPVASSVSLGQAFPVSAAGESPDGVKRMEIWMGGKKLYETWSSQMKHWLTLPAGQHTVSVIAVDIDNSIVSKRFTITVQ